MGFIVIEGLDGCGGETQSKLLEKYLISNKIPHKIFRSPDYTTEIGRRIKMYLDEKIKMIPEDAFALFASDTILTSQKIKKEIGKNFIVMDRYITSTIPYQCARGFDFEKGIHFAQTMNYAKPNAIVYISISPETSMKRKIKEKGKLDYHEKKLEYLAKVREFYFREAEKSVLSKWHIVDGERSVEKIHKDILAIAKRFL